MRYVLLAMILVVVGETSAQEGAYGGDSPMQGTGVIRPSTHYTVPMYQYWYRQPWKNKVWMFSEFEEGKVQTKNGVVSNEPLKLNYNILLETIEAIDDDTTVSILRKYKKAKIIWIGPHKFIHAKSYGYIEIVLDGKISVGKRTTMHAEYEFGKGVPANVSNYDMKSMAVRYTRHYWPEYVYFIVDSKYKIRRASSLVLPKMAPSLKHRLKEFVRDNDIDYRRQADIFAAVQFCNDNLADNKGNRTGQQLEELRIPGGEELRHSEWSDSIYRFDQFKDASLSYDDGTTRVMKLNYNFVRDRFETVNTSGDTIGLAGPARVTTFNFDGTVFINDRSVGALEIIQPGKVGLAFRKQIVYDGIDADIKTYHIRRTWYFINKGRAVKTGDQVLNALFPGHQKEIEAYVYENDVDYQSKGDLMKMLSYCSTL